MGYIGPSDMIRLTGYYLANSSAETGAEDSDPYFGGTMNIDATVKGQMLEGKLDWYHRLDSRIAARKLLSGYGVSLVYRDAKVDGASTTFLPAFGAAGGTVEIPEARARQIELLVTIGYMR